MKTNEERGLAKHVNPADPTGPMLDYRPDRSDSSKPPKVNKRSHKKQTKKRPTRTRPKKRA